MDELLHEYVSDEDLQKFEKKYFRESEEQNVQHNTQFEYAWALVRSRYNTDIQKGILLLEDLATRHSDGTRDYIYYLAIGNVRLKQYNMALKYCQSFLDIEPNNQQVLTLQQHVKDQLKNETVKGITIAGGAVLALGGLVGLGFALAKK
ncbi:mitochondrial fission 1 protein-like isoform X2 [Condylostylus longicornis]|uniref:mitochondrial fission 1 protein-like isoform X2 n=1 Tax=Condylostylus longicornis TaxID=2530218 RepID=UPI00244DD721|nr:mitochondrial fission 1 protein-like isoform X2 [Condylostylus longicornis]XP_055376622.1 mitochondrial fission 1 protein-like isoform X2 [Condylostylus longicornis]